MILEVAILNVREGMTGDFESAFRQASPIIASMKGYLGHELQRCLEASNRYVLLVRWETLEDHTSAFANRRSTRSGSGYYTTFMIRSPRSSITSWCSVIRPDAESTRINARDARGANVLKFFSFAPLAPFAFYNLSHIHIPSPKMIPPTTRKARPTQRVI